MKRSLLFLGALVLGLALFITLLTSSGEQGSVIDGRLVLSEYNIDETGPIKLDGEWEFYWDQLREPGTFDNPEEPITGLMPVPGMWNFDKDRKYPASGQATYRVVIDFPDTADFRDTDHQALLIPRIFTEYKLWVNGQAVSENGITGSSILHYLTPSFIWIHPDDGPIEIILQVKNAHHIFGGIGQSIIFGSAADLIQKRMLTVAFDLALFAVCIFSGIYQLVLYLYHKKMKASFWLAFICFLIGFRGLLDNANLAMTVWPDMPFEFGSRLISLFLPCIAVSLIFYLRLLFSRDIPRPLARFLILVSVIEAILVAILPAPFYLYTGNVYLIFTSAISVLMLYLAVLSMSRKERGSMIFMISTAILLSCGLLDMLSYFRIIRLTGFLMAGLSIFSLSQAIILAIYYSNIEEESLRLNHRIRTTDLNYLRAQIQPHFIFNALGTISSTISRDPDEGKSLLLDFSDFLRGCYSTDREDGLTTLGNEMNTVQSYLSLEKARFRDRLTIVYDLQADETSLVPVLSIQPLVENAVLHGLMPKLGGGMLTISTWQEDDLTHISVEDDGVGIDAKESYNDLNIQGKGIGISNINRRLAILYNSSLQIESTIGKGTRIEMIIRSDA